MFKKYEKTFRVKVPEFTVPGKLHLSDPDLKRMLAGSVDVEEKLDGANTGIIRHKNGFHLQKRGSLVAQSEHEQFQFFHAWSWQMKYESIMRIPVGTIVYGELMRCVHSIFYDHLPDWFIVFDVLTKKGWLNREQREEFCAEYGFANVPLVYSGRLEVVDIAGLLKEESAFGPKSEGIMIKRYRKKEYLRAKLVKPEFIKNMENSMHWTKYKAKTNVVVKERTK